MTSSPKPISSISAQVEPETPVIPDKLCDKEFTLSGAGGNVHPLEMPRFYWRFQRPAWRSPLKSTLDLSTQKPSAPYLPKATMRAPSHGDLGAVSQPQIPMRAISLGSDWILMLHQGVAGCHPRSVVVHNCNKNSMQFGEKTRTMCALANDS